MEVNNKKIFLLAIIVAISVGVMATLFYLMLKKTSPSDFIGASVPKETGKRYAAEAIVETVSGNTIICNVTLHDTQKEYKVTIGKNTKIFSQSGPQASYTEVQASEIHPKDSIDIISSEDFDNKTEFEALEIRKNILPQ